jgi:hypothetical protein
MPVKVRSLYQCSRAKVVDDEILCDMGHNLSKTSKGSLGVIRLERGDSLNIRVCQSCPDYDEMGAACACS